MNKSVLLAACLAPFVVSGCTQQTSTGPSSTAASSPAVDGAEFLLADEPDGAKDVIQVREQSKDGDDVVLVGRIGGSANPWVDGRAAFSIVDRSLKACSDIPGDECPQPWDYCCETDKLPKAMTLVKVMDGSGALVEADARQLLDVQELSTVIIKGKARRDEAGNLAVLASGVYVKQK